jgi:hypothetical protein
MRRVVSNLRSEAAARWNLRKSKQRGYVHQILGELDEAESCFKKAIGLFVPAATL